MGGGAEVGDGRMLVIAREEYESERVNGCNCACSLDMRVCVRGSESERTS